MFGNTAGVTPRSLPGGLLEIPRPSQIRSFRAEFVAVGPGLLREGRISCQRRGHSQRSRSSICATKMKISGDERVTLPERLAICGVSWLLQDSGCPSLGIDLSTLESSELSTFHPVCARKKLFISRSVKKLFKVLSAQTFGYYRCVSGLNDMGFEVLVIFLLWLLICLRARKTFGVCADSIVFGWIFRWSNVSSSA